MQTHFFDRHQTFKDAFGVVFFITCVIIGTLFINTFIFRSFNVEGRSMEETMHDGDRLIVNRLPVTWAQIQNRAYTPERGEIIVFKNPVFDEVNQREEYIVKRVIAFGGERVVLRDGHYTVYNDQHPEGFDPDENTDGEIGTPTSGEIDTRVPEGTLFVSGDHRQGNNSLDSRNGLGFVPLYDVIGPVSLRIFPFDQMRGF